MEMHSLQEQIHGCTSLRGKTSIFSEMRGTHLIRELVWLQKLLVMAIFWGLALNMLCKKCAQDPLHVPKDSRIKFLNDMLCYLLWHWSWSPPLGLCGEVTCGDILGILYWMLTGLLCTYQFSYLLDVLVLILLVICCYWCNWVYVLKVSTLLP